MISAPRTLEIRLIDQLVGWLVQRDGRTGVRFNPAWRDRADRRVLSLSVEELGLQDIRATPHLPAWFENLLFEGELRRWIMESEPELSRSDLALLARLGGDLVGAVTLHPVEDDIPNSAPVDLPEPRRAAPSGGIRWSLAGVQLKMNLAARADRYTLPVHGELGHFIGKFADRRYKGVPINEHATLAWAWAAGVDTVEHELIAADRIDELPMDLRRTSEPVLLVRRYDRDQGRRIHAEEFAQIFGLRPGEKYDRYGWRHQLKLLARVAPDDVAEYLRRLIFVIASGNADAHHKNWSVIYADGRRPRLAPAYDQVSTVAWLNEDPTLADTLPFKLGGSRRWEDVRLSSLLRLLEVVELRSFEDAGATVEQGAFERWLRATVERAKDSLGAAILIAGPDYAAAVERHWARVPLFKSFPS